MAGVNKAIIAAATSGATPRSTTPRAGAPSARLSVATTRAYTNKTTNERVEETEWHRIVVWGKQAEHCNNFLSKGRQVYVEGRIQTRSYEDKEGIKRYSTEIIADAVQFLGGRGSGAEDSEPSQFSPPSASTESSDANAPIGADDDIPFRPPKGMDGHR